MAGGFRNFKSRKQEQKVMILLSKRHGGGAELERHIKKKETEHQNTDTTNIVATKKRREAVLKKLSGMSVISDNELQHITNSLNRIQFSNDDNRRFAEEAQEAISSNPDIKLNEDFTKKGIEFLTRTPIQRQLSSRERDIVEDFKEFTLGGYNEDNNGVRSFFRPMFTVHDHKGNEFTYLFAGSREIEIVE